MVHKVLLADDSATIQKLVEMALSDSDFELLSVSDGAQAVEQLDAFAPDIILADAIMPKLDGYEVCAQVRSSANFANVPVILLTGRFQPFDKDKAEKVGVSEKVVKPFSQEQLVGVMTRLIKEAAPADALEGALSEEEALPEPGALSEPEAPVEPEPTGGFDESATVAISPENLRAHLQSLDEITQTQDEEIPSIDDFSMGDVDDLDDDDFVDEVDELEVEADEESEEAAAPEAAAPSSPVEPPMELHTEDLDDLELDDEPGDDLEIEDLDDSAVLDDVEEFADDSIEDLHLEDSADDLEPVEMEELSFDDNLENPLPSGDLSSFESEPDGDTSPIDSMDIEALTFEGDEALPDGDQDLALSDGGFDEDEAGDDLIAESFDDDDLNLDEAEEHDEERLNLDEDDTRPVDVRPAMSADGTPPDVDTADLDDPAGDDFDEPVDDLDETAVADFEEDSEIEELKDEALDAEELEVEALDADELELELDDVADLETDPLPGDDVLDLDDGDEGFFNDEGAETVRMTEPISAPSARETLKMERPIVEPETPEDFSAETLRSDTPIIAPLDETAEPAQAATEDEVSVDGDGIAAEEDALSLEEDSEPASSEGFALDLDEEPAADLVEEPEVSFDEADVSDEPSEAVPATEPEQLEEPAEPEAEPAAEILAEPEPQLFSEVPEAFGGEKPAGDEIRVEEPLLQPEEAAYFADTVTSDMPLAEQVVPEPEPAEISEPVPQAAAVPPAVGGTLTLDPKQMEQLADMVANRLVQQLGSGEIRDIVWQVVPELAEAMIKKRIYQLEQSVETE